MDIQIQSARISFDEGDYFWVADFELTNHLDGAYFFVGRKFTFDMYEESFSLFVEQRNISKSVNSDGSVEITVTIKCVSPAVQLTAPYANPITKTWDTTTARAIVEEVLGDFSATLDWQILDWAIPSNTFSVSEQSPLDIAKTVVNAVGATIESKPSGGLLVRSLHPTPVQQYGPLTAAHLISDAVDVFQSTEGFVASRISNKLRISNVDEEASQSDRMEFEAGEDGQGILHVYPSPWRENFTVRSTRVGFTTGPQVYAEREEEAQVEIVVGKASVSFPILSLVSVEYLSDDLGGMSFTLGNSQLTTTIAGYSLAKVRYKVRTMDYAISGPVGESAQYLMEDA